MRYARIDTLEVERLIDLYRASSLARYRPLDDPAIVAQMIRHANLMVAAWDGGLLVGLARTLTDFGYVAYLADLVVRESHQKRGIGTRLIRETQLCLGERAKIVLIAAPEAEDYYPKIGFRPFPSPWAIGSREPLRTGPGD